MTQWSDGRVAGPGQPAYGPPASGGYGPPGGGPYGSPYGPGTRPQRETGALVVCVVLLVLALIGSFVASAAVHANLTKDTAAGPGITVPSVGATGGGGGAAGSSPSDPDAQRHRIERSFPLYPGSRRVSSPKRYLAEDQIVEKHGKFYYVTRSVNSVYRWYVKHIARDHLRFGYLARTYYEGTHKLAYLFGSVRYSDGPYGTSDAEFDLQPGRRRGTCVVSVNFFD